MTEEGRAPREKDRFPCRTAQWPVTSPRPRVILGLDPRIPALALGGGRGDIGTIVPESAMPTLFRFLFFCAVIAGSIYGTMVALVTFVEPTEREVTIRIPSERVNPQQ